MVKVIIFKNPNGDNVNVCYPTGEISIEAVLEKDCPKGAIIVDSSVLPMEHNEFFDAWELDNDEIIVNIDKAKEIKKNTLRIERKPLLEAQDILFQRALETNADTSAIVAEKQRLRNITQLADEAASLNELKLIHIEGSN